MYRLFAFVISLALAVGCQTMPDDPSGHHHGGGGDHAGSAAKEREICFVVEDIPNLDGQIDLWLENDNPDMFDNGDWYPGVAAHIGDGWQCVTSGFLISDGDPIRLNGGFNLGGDSHDHWLSEFIYGDAYSHVMLNTLEVDGVDQSLGIIDNGHHDANGGVTGVDDGFTYHK